MILLLSRLPSCRRILFHVCTLLLQWRILCGMRSSVWHPRQQGTRSDSWGLSSGICQCQWLSCSGKPNGIMVGVGSLLVRNQHIAVLARGPQIWAFENTIIWLSTCSVMVLSLSDVPSHSCQLLVSPGELSAHLRNLPCLVMAESDTLQGGEEALACDSQDEAQLPCPLGAHQ